MHAGLSRLGTDFGNGPADQRTFLEDREAEGYQRAKLQCAQWGPVVLQAPAVAERQREALQEIAGFIKDRFAEDCPELTAAGQHSNPPGNHWLNQLGHTAMTMQEDFTVMQRDGKGEDRATLVHVCFPSGWRPERIVGQSFRAIHTPVPDFAEDPRAARSMLESMIGRGPYVRFVWTVCADEHLDHHPERGTRERFDAHTRRAWSFFLP